MALEIAVQVALVGEMEFVDEFLKALVGIYKIDFQFNYCKVVDNLLCILAARPLAYRVEMSGGDSHLVSVELHRPVLSEVVGEQHPELIEQLVFVLTDMLLCQCAVCLAYVLYV